MPSAKSADSVYAERIRAIYDQMPLTLAVSVLNAALVATVLTPVTSPVRIWCWFGVLLLLSAARLGGWFYFRKWGRRQHLVVLWERLAVTGALLSGGAWGFGALLWFPPSEPYQLFIVLVIAGMCAGAATVHATHIPTVAAFVLPATLPLAAEFFAIGGPLQIVSGMMTVVFAVAMCTASFRFQTWFVDTFATQFKLAQRTRELDWANARLKEEVASRLAAEQKLQQSQRIEAIGRVTAGIAHDFNNLLMAIRGVAEIMAQRLGPGSGYADNLATIYRATERGSALTHQLLAFGRKQQLLPRRTDINRVLTGMARLLETTMAGNVALDLRLDPGLEPALVDPEQIEHAILNVVINARDAMPDGGRIAITTANVEIVTTQPTLDLPPGHYVAIVIADTGTGMPEHVRTRAFEPFFTTKAIGKGSGLGLSQVHGLTHQLGGTTTIDSASGEGTTVRIYLPTDPQPLRSPGDAPRPTSVPAQTWIG